MDSKVRKLYYFIITLFLLLPKTKELKFYFEWTIALFIRKTLYFLTNQILLYYIILYLSAYLNMFYHILSYSFASYYVLLYPITFSNNSSYLDMFFYVFSYLMTSYNCRTFSYYVTELGFYFNISFSSKIQTFIKSHSFWIFSIYLKKNSQKSISHHLLLKGIIG